MVLLTPNIVWDGFKRCSSRRRGKLKIFAVDYGIDFAGEHKKFQKVHHYNNPKM